MTCNTLPIIDLPQQFAPNSFAIITEDRHTIASQAWIILRNRHNAELIKADSQRSIPTTEEWIALRERHRSEVEEFEREFGY